MNTDELISALEKILEASVSNDEARSQILPLIRGLRHETGFPPVKGIMARIQQSSDSKVSEEIGGLIREVAFNYV